MAKTRKSQSATELRSGVSASEGLMRTAAEAPNDYLCLSLLQKLISCRGSGEAHGLLNPLQGLLGHRAGPFPPRRQHLIEAAAVSTDFAVTLLNRPEGLHRGLGEQGFEASSAHLGTFAGHLLTALAAE